MTRNVMEWVLITLGLAGIVGGIGMVCIFSMTKDTAAENGRTQDRMNPGGIPAAPPGNSGLVLRYGSAALSVAVGLVLTCWGVGLRGSGPRTRKRGSKKASKHTCASCGGRSPALALHCYQCGQAFSSH